MKKKSAPLLPSTLWGNLLTEPLLNYRRTDTAERASATLPALFVAMTQDLVRDFPALRPHQRHPWHAFLVQLAALALHRTGCTEPLAAEQDWREALLALTPDDPDGAAWCLVSPVGRPAFMQAPEPSGNISGWKELAAADELDMLVTSKNHDLKARRMLHSSCEDWVYALVSLQTQEGFLGAGNYGISRMNGGFASRCGVGILPAGYWGARWRRDLLLLISHRQDVERNTSNSKSFNMQALVWNIPWNGSDALSIHGLDPWYIEICRRVKLIYTNKLTAHTTSSKGARIAAKELNGVTGDPWMPIEINASKALTITDRGFDYKLSAELLLGSKYTKTVAQNWFVTDEQKGVQLLLQGITRGQGKTEGYHERRIPISKKIRIGLMKKHTDELAKIAQERIGLIAEMRKILWLSLTVLFGNGANDESGKNKNASDPIKNRASLFAQPFESKCDARFFSDLIEQIESDVPQSVHEKWLMALANEAECVLKNAFRAGPRNGQLRYRAQSMALSCLHAAMRSNKSKLPELARLLKAKIPNSLTFTDEETHEYA